MTRSSTSTPLSLEAIAQLSHDVLRSNGCDEANAAALTRTIAAAERDGAMSHGLFRLPGYIASLRSGKVDGRAGPTLREESAVLLKMDGANGFAPLALEIGVPALVTAARNHGLAAMAITATHHFAALWHETEALADSGLAAIACVNYAAVVAPHGGTTPIFGTNPLSFAWPRPGHKPVVFDMATAAMAQGEIQIAAREGRSVPHGTGLGPDGEPSTDPDTILKGVQLPFGGYKGSALALMVELLAAGLTGDSFSKDASNDIGDGGPPRGGELLIAFDPARFAGPDWTAHSEDFFKAFDAIPGARLPGSRRHSVRNAGDHREVDVALLETIEALR